MAMTAANTMNDRPTTGLDVRATSAIAEDWRFLAREQQWAPEGDWRTWLMLGGRGSGKTRAGAEWVSGIAARATGDFRIALVGETYADVREVMIDGPAGLLRCGTSRPRFEPSRRRLVWPSGAEALMFSSEDPEALRGPQFHAAWCDELGAPAVDKAANQPNVFPDPKSAESSIPHFSSGARDDLAQHAYLLAHLRHWQDEADGTAPQPGPMVDPGDIFLWTWDARPMPAFPLRRDVWSDGSNWGSGHWLNGRFSGAPFTDLIAAVLKDHRIARFDASRLEGWATGLLLVDPSTARQSLSALIDVHGVSAREEEGSLVFEPMDVRSRPDRELEEWAAEAGEPELSRTRAREADLPAEISLSFRDAFRDHAIVSRTSRIPVDAAERRLAIASPLVMEDVHANAAAQALLRRAWSGRERVELSVPWRQVGLRVGDRLKLPVDDTSMLVTGISDGLARQLTLQRVPAVASEASRDIALPTSIPNALTSGPPNLVILDLPPLPSREGDPSPGAMAALWTVPWRAQALFERAPGEPLRAVGTVERPSMIGRLVEPIGPGPVGPLDRATRMRVQFRGAFPVSVDWSGLLSGRNALAVRCAEGWEIVQHASAEEIAPGLWELTGLLRGRLGTEWAMRSGAPAGAEVVGIDDTLMPLPVNPSLTSLEREWVAGPVGVPMSEDRFASVIAAPGAEAMRPPAPVHLRVWLGANGGIELTWIGRDPASADDWSAPDGPAQGTLYRVEIEGGGKTVLIETDEPRATYSAVDLAANGHAGTVLNVRVREVGTGPEPGRAARIVIQA